jgi:hypothetical protein
MPPRRNCPEEHKHQTAPPPARQPSLVQEKLNTAQLVQILIGGLEFDVPSRMMHPKSDHDH